VRQKAEGPLCGFYAAATARVLRQLNVTADVRITECLAVGGRSCHVAVVIERSKAQHEHPDQAAGSGQ
jgi:predicted hydrocarbon binding protein